MRSFFTKLMGDPNDKELRTAEPIVQEINDLEPEYEALSDEGLRTAFNELRFRYEEGETLEEVRARVRDALDDMLTLYPGQTAFYNLGKHYEATATKA